MYLQTPKRPCLPPTPTSYTKPSLPPLSSIFNGSVPLQKTPYHSTTYKLPSMSTPNSYYTPKAFTFSTPSAMDTSEGDISVLEIRKPASKSTVNPAPAIKTENPSVAAAKTAYAFISHSPSTYPSQEPSIDNAPLARRKRRRTSPNELLVLNNEFDLGSTPNKSRRIEIAGKVNMTEKAVQIWFQNKRQSLRKHLNHEKEVTELPPTTPIYVIPHHPVIPISANVPLMSSTPIKPIMTKSHSLGPHMTSSPIKESSSIPLFVKRRSTTQNTPVSHMYDDGDDDSINTSMDEDVLTLTPSSITPSTSSTSLVLNKTKKKQPLFLNSSASSTMTFKLMPNSKVTQKLNSIAHEEDKENETIPKKSATSFREILDDVLVRKPLGLLTTNRQNTLVKKENEECVENLLSLRAGY